MPAFAKLIAMPPPIVPKPMMAAVRIGRVGVSSGTSGIFAAARSAKKAWRSAFDSGDCTSSMKSPRSKREAFVERPRDGGLDRVDALQRRRQAARLLRDLRARGAEHRRGIGAGRQRRGAVAQLRGRRVRPATSLANASTPSKEPRSTIRSTRPLSSASSALIGSPLVIIRRPFSAPTARGSRCVPPAPGSRPIFTSGRPIDASGVAIR